MESTENQRFNTVINFLLNQKKFLYIKDIASIMGVNEDRIRYLRKENGGQLSSKELKVLSEKIPDIDWMWVKLGEGSMLATDNIAKEDAEMYAHKVDCKEDALAKILSGESCLPIEEQNKLLRREVLKLKDRIIKDSENKDPLKLLEEMKRMLGS